MADAVRQDADMEKISLATQIDVGRFKVPGLVSKLIEIAW